MSVCEKFCWWFHDHIIYPLKQYYYKHRKTHYVCGACGLIAAPYFEYQHVNRALDEDYGWKRLPHNKWLCHQCAYHVSLPGWAATVKEQNDKTRMLIYCQDREYWLEHFERKTPNEH